jgi:hypothetical protein
MSTGIFAKIDIKFYGNQKGPPRSVSWTIIYPAPAKIKPKYEKIHDTLL